MRSSILDTIGSPLVELEGPPGATVAAKIESANPGRSAKDRPAMAMVRAAERSGALEPGDRLVEPTSGNTGIGLALVCAARGYDLTIVMPGDKSPERRAVMAAYGADIELVDGDMSAARDRADVLAADGAVQLGQFDNPANPEAHYQTTGGEILEQIGDRSVDAFVAGVGTGGTISGVGRRLRERFPDVDIVAVEPERNAVLSTGESGDDEFQGMGPGFVSENLDRSLIDDIETVAIEEAEAECRRLAREEGILVGQSSGATSLVARAVAESIATSEDTCPELPDALDRQFGDGSDPRQGSPHGGDAPSQETRTDGGADVEDCPLVVTIFWDSGERYLSTGMFD